MPEYGFINGCPNRLDHVKCIICLNNVIGRQPINIVNARAENSNYFYEDSI